MEGKAPPLLKADDVFHFVVHGDRAGRPPERIRGDQRGEMVLFVVSLEWAENYEVVFWACRVLPGAQVLGSFWVDSPLGGRASDGEESALTDP